VNFDVRAAIGNVARNIKGGGRPTDKRSKADALHYPENFNV